MWIPAVVLDEIEDIRREDDIHSHAEAMRKMVKYTRVGRETKRIMTLDFSKSIKRRPVEDFNSKETKK